jgi:hypothetical protein
MLKTTIVSVFNMSQSRAYPIPTSHRQTTTLSTEKFNHSITCSSKITHPSNNQTKVQIRAHHLRSCSIVARQSNTFCFFVAPDHNKAPRFHVAPPSTSSSYKT